MVVLGQQYRDNITGFSGVAVARCTYLNGCVRISLQPTVLKDGLPIDERYFDEQQLIADSTARAGGPRDAPQRAKDAPRL